jgi:hypothetical protein
VSVTQAQAWAIFEADKRGNPEAEAAKVQMTDEEMEQYTAFETEWEMKLAQIGVEAQNEAATIAEDNPTIVQEVETLHAYDWTADHYIKVVSLFKGSKFEKLHLSAAFRVPNAELLLGLVKP